MYYDVPVYGVGNGAIEPLAIPNVPYQFPRKGWYAEVYFSSRVQELLGLRWVNSTTRYVAVDPENPAMSLSHFWRDMLNVATVLKEHYGRSFRPERSGTTLRLWDVTTGQLLVQVRLLHGGD